MIGAKGERHHRAFGGAQNDAGGPPVCKVPTLDDALVASKHQVLVVRSEHREAILARELEAADLTAAADVPQNDLVVVVNGKQSLAIRAEFNSAYPSGPMQHGGRARAVLERLKQRVARLCGRLGAVRLDRKQQREFEMILQAADRLSGELL